jgi:hypothetical protein
MQDSFLIVLLALLSMVGPLGAKLKSGRLIGVGFALMLPRVGYTSLWVALAMRPSAPVQSFL